MADPTPDPDDRRGADRRAGDRGPPEAKHHQRGWREGDPDADSILPGRRFGAGGEVEDGPERGGGA
jgi:hypothetical protein